MDLSKLNGFALGGTWKPTVHISSTTTRMVYVMIVAIQSVIGRVAQSVCKLTSWNPCAARKECMAAAWETKVSDARCFRAQQGAYAQEAARDLAYKVPQDARQRPGIKLSLGENRNIETTPAIRLAATRLLCGRGRSISAAAPVQVVYCSHHASNAGSSSRFWPSVAVPLLSRGLRALMDFSN